jgi:hypothetical protein
MVAEGLEQGSLLVQDSSGRRQQPLAVDNQWGREGHPSPKHVTIDWD